MRGNMPLKAIEDEFSSVPGAKKRYARRQLKARKDMHKCIRCPVWDLKDGLLVTKVSMDGVVTQKRLLYCAEHQGYVRVKNKQYRGKHDKRG